MRDIREKILPAIVLAGADHAGDDETGTAVDMQGFNSCAFFMEVGTITGTGAVTPVMEECDTVDGTYTTVGAEDIIADDRPLEALESGVNKRFGYAGIKRFVRPATVVTGTISAATYSIIAVQGDPSSTPTDY